VLLLAVTALEKLKTLPPAIWMKIAIAVAAFVLTIFLFRRVMKMNKIIASVVVFVVGTVVFFSWVYNRNEPKFMTPLVEKIAPFFPSAGSYSSKQQTAPKP
jgi:glucan phosphoethanolaminetransferase (alkaline phosphatase superfamily)